MAIDSIANTILLVGVLALGESAIDDPSRAEAIEYLSSAIGAVCRSDAVSIADCARLRERAVVLRSCVTGYVAALAEMDAIVTKAETRAHSVEAGQALSDLGMRLAYIQFVVEPCKAETFTQLNIA